MTYATDIFLGDGSTAAFDLTFDYLQRDHVHVYIVASDQPGAARTELTVVETGSPGPGEYVWSTDIRITVGTAPPVGEYLWIQRETPEDQQIVQWVDGSYIVATDLNTSDKQWLYSIQELHDLIDTINGVDPGNALKGITVTAPLESDTTDPQIPILSVDEAVSTDDPNALTSDVQLMSAKAIDLAFSQAVGSTSSYPPSGVTAKVGKLLVDTYGSNPCLYYWTGSAWQKIYAEDADLSTTDDLPEGSVNLYYTDARVEAYVSGAGYIKNLTGLDTDDLAEGSVNLYYTDARVEAYVNGAGYIKGPVVTKIIAGANIGISPGSGVGEVTINASGGGGGGGIPEAPLDGTLYGRESAAWVAAVAVAGDNMTGDLTLGTNKITLDAGDGSSTFAGKVTSGLSGSEVVLGTQDVGTASERGRLEIKVPAGVAPGAASFAITEGSTQTVRFNTGGSGTFAGNISSGNYFAGSNTGAGVQVFNTGNIYLQQDGTGATNLTPFRIYYGTAIKAQFTNQGDLTTEGKVTANSFDLEALPALPA